MVCLKIMHVKDTTNTNKRKEMHTEKTNVDRSIHNMPFKIKIPILKVMYPQPQVV